jgi:hypothetical protein
MAGSVIGMLIHRSFVSLLLLSNDKSRAAHISFTEKHELLPLFSLNVYQAMNETIIGAFGLWFSFVVFVFFDVSVMDDHGRPCHHVRPGMSDSAFFASSALSASRVIVPFFLLFRRGSLVFSSRRLP